MSVVDVADDVTLADRYERRVGRVHLTGIQALARLPIDQARRDRLTGRRIGTYVSGYEGSPLAGYDLELISQRDLLDEHDIVFEQGLNEEAAAMAVQGSQLLGELPATVEGVVGFWYGKAPGLDRATDAIRHANLMGTAPTGGVVALVGDDPAAKSSSVPCASERALADLTIPTFYPADAAEVLELGRHAIALSRASGLWTAMKIVTAVADGSASVDLLDDPAPVVVPVGSHAHEPTAKLLAPVLGPLERDFATTRLRIVDDYVRLNGLNRVVVRHADDRVGILTSGKTYLDVREALTTIGLDDAGLERAGIRILKVDVVWPLAADAVRELADGLDEIVVVEEKRSFLETAAKDVLYGLPGAPVVTGKTDVDGSELFASYGELDADSVALGLAKRLAGRPGAEPVDAWLAARRDAFARERLQLPILQRTPYFCSGCPHNTSTKPQTDSPVGGGIGCHAMVLLMDPKQVGDVVGLTQMGGEGTQWLGMAPFVEAPHFVQNLGDGTFHHSGSLAIRAAVASRRNLTYRILYNSTVAMTGGQDAVGQMDLARMVANLRSEGVARIIVTTDDVRRTRREKPGRGVTVWPRTRIGEAEAELAATPGVTVLIHDQECATELRRKRKRGLVERPTEKIMINERICEGCGDCGEKSNCLSVHPVETEHGRKTTIHQASCNTDLTCLTGDCPAFMTVTPGARRTGPAHLEPLDADALPRPAVSAARDQAVRLMGIGGTGVVTTTQVLATAALLSGRHVRSLDQTGVAQKGGAVVSDVRFSPEPFDTASRIGEAGCDLYLGLDGLVAVAPANLAVLAPAATVVLSTSMTPTGAMVSDRTVSFPAVTELVGRIESRLDGGQVTALDVRAIVEPLFGAEQLANLFMVGVAYQLGALSLEPSAIEGAVELNGVAVDANVQAFRRGRQLVADPDGLHAAVAQRTAAPAASSLPSRAPVEVRADAGSELERLVRLRGAELVAYQDEAYARRYERLVERVRSAEEALGRVDGSLSEAVARHYFKLLAYKDEYEVARLALDPHERERVAQEAGADARVQWRLHPPVLRALGMRRKIALGPWFGVVFAGLYRLRRLRGTVLDPFGYAHVRRVERDLVTEYEATVARLLEVLDDSTHAAAVEIAALPDMVRGYEHVKLTSVVDYRSRVAAGLAALEAPPAT
ncbi:indolepyruvate ferredoxin oxidoreductase family protein [Aeromicrobium endophyticum]|uniref:Indolepyruvate ferredoxin oxidoreductase family protein n=3 Tax=Aeromicrobium endophyticum TaxID=2292704 RepID=A0A371PAJ1_9ACTN|nr:indolepyruvate ferredoxin oxidoreductase family protein [Aeromicrobium endophyticum]REK72974.1 indolepyruvate ferredoxin oxidoreductase family protein [Aeromicrobium endophyticum]